MTWIVVLPEMRIAYPFGREETARQFAAFLVAEVDPAEVRPAPDGPPDGYLIRDPVAELLTWRECVALPRMGDRQ